jgi:hypothetical protein
MPGPHRDGAGERLAFFARRGHSDCAQGKTIVPIYRNRVIAQLKPATRTGIDFGLALGELKGRGRLVETEGFAKRDRITHRIPIAEISDTDAGLVALDPPGLRPR